MLTDNIAVSRRTCLGLMAGTAAGLALSPFAARPAAAQGLRAINVIMPLPRSANFYPLIAGEALGYFEKEGVKVNLLPSSTTVPYVAFVQNGQAELAMLDAPQTFQSVQAGIPIKVVYEGMQLAPEGIAVSADSPITSVEQLKGTTVGLVSDRDRTTLAIALDTKGISIDDVKTVVVGEAGPTLANAFRKQTVSAISGAVPDWLSLQANGMKIRLITPSEVADTPANSFVVNAARIDELRQPLIGFFRAWSKGMVVGKVDVDTLAVMCRKAVPEEWENPTFGREFLDASIPMNYSVTPKLGDLQPEVWKRVQGPMVKLGELQKEIDPATFLDRSLIDPANDFSREQVAADVAAWKAKSM